jgi:hypothetical protein
MMEKDQLECVHKLQRAAMLVQDGLYVSAMELISEAISHLNKVLEASP